MAIVPIYVLAGQSNAGILEVGESVKSRLADLGGRSALVQLDSPNAGLVSEDGVPDWNPASADDLFSQIMTQVWTVSAQIQLAGDTPVAGGVLWVQGERDAADATSAAAYQVNLEDLIAAVRGYFGDEPPFVIAELRATADALPFSGDVRDAQQAVANGVNDLILETDDFDLSVDGVHYSTTGSLSLGSALVDAIATRHAALVSPVDATPIAIDGTAGDDEYIGGPGDDVIAGRDGLDTLFGGGGADLLRGNNDADRIYGGDGDDRLYGDAGDDFIVGGDGNDVIIGGSGADTMFGGLGSDFFYVTDAGDVVMEQAGEGTDDRVITSVSYALAADVHVERLQTISVAATDAIDLTGNEFAQTLIGNAGTNVLDGGGGADMMSGGAGDDTYMVDDAGDVIVEAAGNGNDTVITSVSYVLAAAGAEVETLRTSDASLTTALDLTGNRSVQEIQGNDGANRIDGQGGSDTLYGYGGEDTFVFSTTLTSANVDTIVDFTVGEDSFELDSSIFAGLTRGQAISADQFVTNTSGFPSAADHRIIYEADTGKLFFDADGDGAGGRKQFAIVSTDLALINDDFFVA